MRVHVGHVVFPSPDRQVVWVDAAPYVARVTDFQAVGMALLNDSLPTLGAPGLLALQHSAVRILLYQEAP